MTVDRRVKYTKKMLREAIVLLLKNKTINEISVTELCKVADVNRSTFYSHYRDSFDLFEELEDETYQSLNSILETYQHRRIEQRETALQAILEYIAANQELFQILLRDYHNGKFKQLITELTKGIIENETREREQNVLKYMEAFTSSGSISIIKQWLDGGMVESSEFMAEFIYRVVKKGILGEVL